MGLTTCSVKADVQGEWSSKLRMFTSQGSVQSPLCDSARSVMQKVLRMAWMVNVLVDVKSSAPCRFGRKCLKNTSDHTAVINHALTATATASRTTIGAIHGSTAATLAIRNILADMCGTSLESLDRQRCSSRHR